jgi:hypothetical protein
LKRIRYILTLLLLLGSFIVNSQITVQFNPIANGQSIQNLSMVQLFSSSTYPIQIALTIKVKEQVVGNVLDLKTGPFVIRQGANFIDRSAFSNARFSFFTNDYSVTIKESAQFPEGDYEYCFQIEVLQTKDASVLPRYEQCFNFQVQPLTPLLLISPIDRDEMCNKRPSFIWQPPMPLSVDSRLRLILTEIKEKQDPIEAIAFNAPLINQAEIRTNSLNYPVNIPELKEGASYAWQVTVYSNKTILKKSEIWTFKVKCKNESTLPSTDSYRQLKEADEGDYYIASNFLRFSLNNPYVSGILSYSIECISDPKAVVKSLPRLQLSPGLNKYEIDLNQNGSFKTDKEYLLKVFLPNSRLLKLRFIYKSEE